MDSQQALQLRDNNPYALGNVFQFMNGDLFLDDIPLIYVKQPTDRYFTITDADDCWGISYQAYSDSKYYWLIGKANGIIDYFAEFTTGTTIIIPDLSLLSIQPNPIVNSQW